MKRCLICVLAAAILWTSAEVIAESYRYDRSGRLTQVSYDTDPPTLVQYEYDDNGNMIRVTVLSDAIFENGFE